MADDHSIRCGTIIAGTIAAGLALSYAGAFGAGYATSSCNAENTQACHEQLLPLKQKFKENCEGKFYDDLDQKTLKKITAERDQIQGELVCEKERWICRPIDQYHVQESRTEAVYKLE